MRHASPLALDQAAPDSRTRVLVVDDSVVARGLFTRWIGEHPHMVVVGSAADGVNAVRAACRHKPDIVILDLDMPVMDGLTALPEILKGSPASVVLIASSLTARSARLSMQCLALGAVDLLPKPDTNRDLTLSVSFREEMLRKLEGLSAARMPSRTVSRAPSLRHLAPIEAPRAELIAPFAEDEEEPRTTRAGPAGRAVLIGASTGGPRAVTAVLERIGPALAKVPVFVVQHMPAVFTTSFAEQLSGKLGRPAREARDGEVAVPGMIYVAPGGRHLRLQRWDGRVRIRIEDGAPVRFCRPSIDIAFADAALCYGAGALAAVLTGMGTDGLEGAAYLRKAGATVLAQDEASSVVWGMPGAVSRHGLATQTLPPEEIGEAIALSLRAGATP